MSRATTSPKLAQFLGADMSNEQAVRAGVKAAGGGDAMVGARILRQSLQQFGEFERKEIEKENNEKVFQKGMRGIKDGKDVFDFLAQDNTNVNATVAGALADVQASRARAAKDLADSKRGQPARDPIALNQQAYLLQISADEQKKGRPLTDQEKANRAREMSYAPEPDEKTPNFKQHQDALLKSITKIRALLNDGKDDDAIDIAVASGMKGPFGDPADLDYLKKTFGKNQPAGTLNTGTPPPDANIPTLTPDQARAAAPGTIFRTIDGRIRTR